MKQVIENILGVVLATCLTLGVIFLSTFFWILDGFKKEAM